MFGPRVEKAVPAVLMPVLHWSCHAARGEWPLAAHTMGQGLSVGSRRLGPAFSLQHFRSQGLAVVRRGARAFSGAEALLTQHL